MQQIKGPIGVFDSGYGGLTILRKLQEACPLWVPIVETGESDSPGNRLLRAQASRATLGTGREDRYDHPRLYPLPDTNA